jgi:hypothetical protein
MKTIISALLIVLATSFSSLALADGHTTLRVVMVNTDDVDAYVAELTKGKEIMSKIAPKMNMRAWQATFAGPNTGAVIVGLEYPGSLADFAAAWDKILADKKMASWLKGLSPIRTLVGDSLYRELSI